mmetsp:Transcript_117063/g.372715  ORF Transcript_117063/g.372715 Transcript_117063/m.372715 type:complete len:847 (+) Transcript_117063:92-2632(+)
MSQRDGALKHVVKRDGRRVPVDPSRIERRVRDLCDGLNPTWVDPVSIAGKILEGLHDGVTSASVDDLAAETCAYMAQRHPDCSVLAARLVVSRLHKKTSDSFSATCRRLWEATGEGGMPDPAITEDLWAFVRDNAAELDSIVDYSRDFSYDYFGLRTLERSYLLRLHGAPVERPQHLLMRTACSIHIGDLEAAAETYRMMSQKLFTHASPTLFNAGTPVSQLSSCFLLTLKDSSTAGVFETLRQCAMISASGGGIGVAFTGLPAAGTEDGHNGRSQGLLPVMRVFNESARLADQGGGKRKGAFAAYLEPWHADIFDFLELRRNHGCEDRRARDLFYGLWIPDLFMRRVEADAQWTLFCPTRVKGVNSSERLEALWGEEFEKLYERMEVAGLGKRTVPARTLWFRILEAQMETGMPYMLYKDAVNRKSNQQHLGTLRCSNLCTEVVQFCSPDEVAVCNLASLALPAFCVPADGETPSVATLKSAGVRPPLRFDFERFQQVTRVIVRNLNLIIDRNRYPIEEAKRSNMRHRPIGIGVQGFADALLKLRLPYDGPEARLLNEDIFEALYFAACDASCELAARDGPYETYQGSPSSRGQLQFDLWGVTPKSGRWDWAALKARIREHGLRNSLLVAPMPTASTAQILGNSESFEPHTQNLYVRRVLSGEFVQLNRFLVEDLDARGLWTDSLRQRLIARNGSVQELDEVPTDLKALYKTSWEIKQKVIVDMAADRGPFVDQSQSLNIFMRGPTVAKLTSMHFWGWRRGLKTGMYYLRTQSAVDAIKVTVDQKTMDEASPVPKSASEKSLEQTPEKGELVKAERLCFGAYQPPRRVSSATAAKEEFECLSCSA